MKKIILIVLFICIVLSEDIHAPTDTDRNEAAGLAQECPVPDPLDVLLLRKSESTKHEPAAEAESTKVVETDSNRVVRKRNFIGLQTLILKYFYMPVKRTLAFLFEEVDNDTHFVMKKGLKDSEQVKKYKCLPCNESSSIVSYVPESSLMKEMNKTSGCGLVLFYSPYCRFSINILPPYKALARVFPQLAVLAVKITSYSSSCIQFGAVGTPTVMLFFNSRPIQKMPVTLTNITAMAGYIANITDLTPSFPLELNESDYEGVELLHSFDWVLLFSVLFLSGSTCYNILSTQAGKRLLEKFKLKRD